MSWEGFRRDVGEILSAILVAGVFCWAWGYALWCVLEGQTYLNCVGLALIVQGLIVVSVRMARPKERHDV